MGDPQPSRRELLQRRRHGVAVPSRATKAPEAKTRVTWGERLWETDGISISLGDYQYPGLSHW